MPYYFQGREIDDPSCISVTWKIDRVDIGHARRLIAETRQKKETSVPLVKSFTPVWYQLDWNRVPSELVQILLNVLESKDHRPMLKYRDLFSAIKNPELFSEKGIRFFHHVRLPEYREDKKGQPLNEYELFERISGTTVLIAGNVESVQKFGRAPMKDKDKWTQKNSDLLAHFLQVVGQIQRSRWIKAPCTMTVSGGKRQGEFSSLEEFVYAAAYFRQLFSDHLFQNACRCYYQFADSPPKVSWVGAEAKGFNDALGRETQFVKGFNRRSLIECFLYGAGLFHSITHCSSKTAKNAQKFWGLINKEDHNTVYFEINSALRDMLGHASKVAAVVHSDFGHWLNNEGIPKPNVYWHTNILAHHSKTRSDQAER